MNLDDLIRQVDPARHDGDGDSELLESIFLRVVRSSTINQQQRFSPSRTAGALAAAGVVALAATGLALHLSDHPQDVRAVLVSAIRRTTAANTARITSTSSSTTVTLGMTTSTGVVNFDENASESSYPNGFTMINIGDQGWTTTWPPDPAHPWTPVRVPPAPTPAERQLIDALQPSTAPSTLLSALSVDTDGVVETQPGKYQATIGSSWKATVTVADGMLSTVSVVSPTGTVTTRYSDYGVVANIQPPTSSTPALNYLIGAEGVTGNTGSSGNQSGVSSS
jgi:hypothetical protein